MKQFFATFLVLIITANLSYSQSNSAQITQMANNTQSTVIQTGDSNDAVMDIHRDWATSSIQQIGNDNNAIQFLTGGGPLLYEIEQNGNGNTAEQNDNAFVYNPGITDWFDTSTWTDDSITQVIWTSSIPGVTPKMKIVQTGFENEAYQYGNKYYTLIEQYGDSNKATQNQTGSGNIAEINQGIGNNNYAYQRQNGSNNSAECNQNGYNLTHNLWQQGNDLSISVSQTNPNPASFPDPVNIKQQ